MKNINKNKIFLFQGQGSFSKETICQLDNRSTENILQRAEDVLADYSLTPLSDYLDAKYLPVGEKKSDIDKIILQQSCIYIESYLIAKSLMNEGIKPDLLMGHSFGEFAALACADAISFEDGITIICKRISLLEQKKCTGKMASVGLNAGETSRYLSQLADHDIVISVINTNLQTVISGSEISIEHFTDLLAKKAISCTMLTSPFPFHSPHLLTAVQEFKEFLDSITFDSQKIPIYMPTEGVYYNHSSNIPSILASHLVTRFQFNSAMEYLNNFVGSKFYDCTSSQMLMKITKNMPVISNKADFRNVPELLSILPNELQNINTIIHKVDQNEIDGCEPIAIISSGCVFPDAFNKEEYWNNMLNGHNSIKNYDTVDPYFIKDFYKEGGVTSNKTYSRLCAVVDENSLISRLSNDEKEKLKDFTLTQKMLYLSLTEAIKSMVDGFTSQEKTKTGFFYGATADGIKEYDKSLVMSQIKSFMKSELESSVYEDQLSWLESNFGSTDPSSVSPDVVYQQVVNMVLDHAIPVTLVDAACASSLYSVDLGIRSLVSKENDIAICGGGFAAGIGNNCLFAQFNGLAKTNVTPLDAAAEGTMFSDGAGVLVLKRLSDAIKNDDNIEAVIRSVGVSSDGKSAAVNVPTSSGQKLAIDRAYRLSGVDKDTIQYVEAHATATSGDAIEFQSLVDGFGKTRAQNRKIVVGANKSLIGHTGWASGVSSIIKIVQAIKEKTIPAQFNISTINKYFDIENTSMKIITSSTPWDNNIGSLPRRAAVNGFGFGGTNAHVVIEEYSESFHKLLIEKRELKKNKAKNILNKHVFVDLNQCFSENSHLSQSNAIYALPKTKIVLPDVKDQMSKNQFMAVMVCEKLIQNLQSKGVDLGRVGLSIGYNDKLDKACVANHHIFKDRILRIASNVSATELRVSLLQLLNNFYRILDEGHLQTGPYTLPGIMPNVVSGRVANMFDLNGPNYVCGGSEGDFYTAIKSAIAHIECSEIDVMLCGSMCIDEFNLHSKHTDNNISNSEGSLMLALCKEDFAIKNELKILAECEIGFQEIVPTLMQQAV